MKRLTGLGLAAAALLSACGGGGSKSSAPSLEKAVRSYTAAFLGGDSETAYGVFTQRCQDAVAKTQFKAIVDQAAARYGTAKITRYTDDMKGNTATATYELSDPTLNQTSERWVLEGNSWHNDDCSL